MSADGGFIPTTDKPAASFSISTRYVRQDIADERVREARRIPDEITKERAQQDAQWGGAEHDDEHGCYEWVEYIQKQVSYAWDAAMKRDTLR